MLTFAGSPALAVNPSPLRRKIAAPAIAARRTISALRVDISGRRSTRELRSCFRPSFALQPFFWRLRDHGEHWLVAQERRLARWRSRPTGGAAAPGPTSGTTTGYGAPSGTSGNGAARRAGVPCGSPAAASSYGPACGAAYRRPATTSRAARCSAATRDPSRRAAAAPSDDETPRATYRRPVEPKHIARCGRATVAKGTDRNAGAAA